MSGVRTRLGPCSGESHLKCSLSALQRLVASLLSSRVGNRERGGEREREMVGERERVADRERVGGKESERDRESPLRVRVWGLGCGAWGMVCGVPGSGFRADHGVSLFPRVPHCPFRNLSIVLV